MPTFPTLAEGGPKPRRSYQLEPEWPVVTGPKFADGGQDTFLSFTTPTRRWLFEYDQLLQIEAAVLDDFHAEVYGTHLGFDFTDPETGILYAGVKIEKYDRHGHNVKTIQARTVQLIKRP